MSSFSNHSLKPKGTSMKARKSWSRREVLKAAGAAAVVSPVIGADPTPETARPKGRIKQSICRWCYSQIPLERLAAAAVKMGFKSVELLTIEEVKALKPFGLTCAMMRCASIAEGLNRPKYHDKIEKELQAHIEFAAAEGLPNVICMSGNRGGMADEEGLANCVAGLKRVLGLAEAKKVTICMEGLNSRQDHKDYMYDKTSWGVELAKRLGSPRFRLLYDIYHMQIMEGDVIRTIQDHKDLIAHYHTGGVPGRHEIDDTQELKYATIVKAILDTGYQGYLGQEFIPVRDPFESLAQSFRICDV
jgi:hydroxypyruvate isomerase